MPAISIIHAPGDALFGDKIAAALSRDGHQVQLQSGDFQSSSAGLEESLAIVVWSRAAANLARIHEEAREALLRGALIPVAIGAAEPPSGFEDLPPVDLSGWAGDPRDPRWRFVLGEIDVAARRDILEDGAVWAGSAVTEQREDVGIPASAISSDADWPPENEEYTIDDTYDAGEILDAPLDHGRDYRAPRRAARFRPFHVAIGASLGLVALTAAAAFLAPIFLSPPDRLASGLLPAPDDLASVDDASAPEVEADAPPTLAFVKPAAIDSEGNALSIPEKAANTGNFAPAANEFHAGEDPLAAEANPAPAIADSNAMEELVAAAVSDAVHANTLTEEVNPFTDEVTTNSALGDYFKDCGSCPEMATLPAGGFSMGSPFGEPARLVSEGPVTNINISKRFALGAREVTFEQWQACVDDGGCKGYAPYDHGWGRGERPVLGVSFEDAQSYAAWLSAATGEDYRLPSEAEWEYAARAGSAAPFSFGYTVSTAEANFNGEFDYGAEGGANRKSTTPTASFAPNAFGLFDMHGNVWEWTADCWADSHTGAQANGSPRGGAPGGDCATRVLKGGAWNSGGWRLRSAHRIGKNRTVREYDNGFRVARNLD